MRKSHEIRNTKETQIEALINLDGCGKHKIESPIGFFNHMLALFAFHSNIDLDLSLKGDIEVCDHHMVEDCGILLGKLFADALANKAGIQRYGSARIVMDETLCSCDLDISGRPYLVFHADFKRESIQLFSTEMVKEFFYAFAMHAKITVHINVLYGDNDHHKIEAIFKSFARALREAIEVVGENIPSSKGVIE